jgi:hypothetical protein
MENGFIESFNGRLRDECLNVEWFTSLDDARRKRAAWRYHYNHERPHSVLPDQTPASVAAEHGSEVKRRFAFSILARALGVPPQWFAAPADAALDPGRRAPSKAALQEGEAPSRSAGERRKWSTFIDSLECTKPAFYAVGRTLTVRILWFPLVQFSGAGHSPGN